MPADLSNPPLASLEKRRLQLEDLLWDFDDFTHPDEFDQSRVAALQAATKALALDIVDTARRLKFEAASPAIPRGGFPPLPPLPVRSLPASRPQSARSMRPRTLSKPRAAPETSGLPPQSPRLAPQSFTNPFSPGGGPEEDDVPVPIPEGIRPTRSQSAVSHGPYQPLRHDVSRDAFTPPASPGIGPVLAPRSQGLPLNTSQHRGTFDPAASPSTIDTRTSVVSNTSSSSSAMLGSLDSLVIADGSAEMDRPVSEAMGARLSATRSTVTTDSDPSLIGVEDLLKESSLASDRRKSRPASPRIPECAIREGSTYYKLKGLCRGATRFRKDGHWDSIKITDEFDGGMGAGGSDMMRASDGITVPFHYETTKVGACGDCGYAHDLDEVELDKDNRGKSMAGRPEAPYPKAWHKLSPAHSRSNAYL